MLSQKCDYFKSMFRSNIREVPDCSKAVFLEVLEYLCVDVFAVNINHQEGLSKMADVYLLEGLKVPVCIQGIFF